MHLKVSGRSEPPEKAIGVAKRQSGHQKSQIFLHARHRATNTKLGLRSSNATTFPHSNWS